VTIDVMFGELVETPAEHSADNKPGWYVQWEPMPRENDGCDPEYSTSAGTPRRSFSYVGWQDWLESFPAAWTFAGEMAEPGPYDDEMLEIKLLSDVGRIIEALPSGKEGTVLADRNRWFIYWKRRAVETFGDRAAVKIYF
jgi:hypothetical protein